MAKATIVVTGDAKLNAKLRRLKTKDAKAAVRTSSRAAAKVLARALATGAPRLTGRLARSYKVRAIKRSRKKVGTRVTTSIPYAGPVEYGARGIPGQHTMRDTTKREEPAIVKIYHTELGKEIERRMKH